MLARLTLWQIYHEVMGKLSRCRLKMLEVLNKLPDEEQRRLKLVFRDSEAERTRYASSLAARFLKDSVVPSAAEVARALTTLETWYLA